MWRSILSVVAGAALWSALWISFGLAMQAAFPDVIDPARYLGHVPTLLGYLVASFVFSVAAGYVTGLAAKSSRCSTRSGSASCSCCWGLDSR